MCLVYMLTILHRRDLLPEHPLNHCVGPNLPWADAVFGGIVAPAIAWGVGRASVYPPRQDRLRRYCGFCQETSHPVKQGLVALSVYIRYPIVLYLHSHYSLLSMSHNVQAGLDGRQAGDHLSGSQ